LKGDNFWDRFITLCGVFKHHAELAYRDQKRAQNRRV
jgi:hypothetical protein